MKNKCIYILTIVWLVAFTACEDYLDVNKDPNNPAQVTEDLLLPAGITSVAYVMGGRYQVLGALWSQHWTQSIGASQYKNIDSYDITGADFDDRQYGELYTGALKNLGELKELSAKNQSWRYYLIATLMQCYTYQVLADLYDEIPFSTALQGEDGSFSPAFEKGQDIYDSLIARIDYALSLDFENEQEIDNLPEPGKDDLVFGGDIDMWKSFAKTLKLKIYMRQCYARPNVAETGIRALFEDDETDFFK
ncbi:MAG: SusD/RagB family nutrient-binding outer membrane lipoprotein [Bacteroidales bacterium]|nr:SusD/RagB family nutrient-binding outer membrane lipoprotein [Bacteroidales bacterium]